MKVDIRNITDGGYGLPANNDLYFSFDNENELITDKKSALVIAYTLFDSLNLIDDDVQDLFYEAEDILNGLKKNKKARKIFFRDLDI